MTGGVSCPKPTYKKPKPEKVQKIRLQDEKECWNCGYAPEYGLELHHCVFGNGMRELANEWGLVVWLCPICHRSSRGIHHRRDMDIKLKQEAQRAFERQYGHEKWMEIFGRSYL